MRDLAAICAFPAIGALVAVWLACLLRECGIRPLRALARPMRRPRWEALAALVCVGGLVHHGATKYVATSPSVSDAAMAAPDTPLAAQAVADPGTSLGWTAAAGVRATGIFPGETSVLIRAHWPSPPADGASGIEVYARPRLDAGGWSGVGTAAIPAGVDGVAIEIPRSILPDGMSEAMFFTLGLDSDADGDGLSDACERLVSATDPLIADTDGDGLPDGWEVRHGFDPLSAPGTGEADADADGDGLPNAAELALGTDPLDADTDGDGACDGVEVSQGSDPNDATDSGAANSRVRVSFCFGDHSGSHSEKYLLTVTPVEGRGERPSSYDWINANYGVCETRTALLKPGWRYEVRLAHSGTKPGVNTDYDYTLTQTGELPPNVVLVDGETLFGVDDTSTAFAGEGKVASVYVLKFDFLTPAGDPGESSQSASGIGQNQFTYDDGASSLSVLLQVEVQPTIPEELGLTGTFRLPAIQGATLMWSDDCPNGTVTTRTDEGFDVVKHSILSARAKYQGYPTRNGGFGRKTATFACRGMTISQDFEVFFPKFGKRHPPCAICPNCPNWFYYWRDGAVCGINDNCVYDDTAVYGYTLPGFDRLIRLGPRAALVNSGPEPYESSLDGFGSVVVTGSGKGIQCVAETIQHEAHHLDIYDRFHGQGEDPDGDGIPTTEEGILDGMTTHPNNPNTYNLDEVYQKYGDDEVRCRKIEQSLSIPMYPASDWANPGCQHKNQYGPKVQR